LLSAHIAISPSLPLALAEQPTVHFCFLKMAAVGDDKVAQGSGLCVKNGFLEVEEQPEEMFNRNRRQCRTMPYERHSSFEQDENDESLEATQSPTTSLPSPQMRAPVLLGQEDTHSPVRGKRRVKTCHVGSAMKRSPSLESADEDARPYLEHAADLPPVAHRRAKTCMNRSPSIDSAEDDAPKYPVRPAAEEERAPPLSRAGRRAYFCTEELREEIEIEPSNYEDFDDASPHSHRRYTTEDLQDAYGSSTESTRVMYTSNGEKVAPRLPIESRSCQNGESTTSPQFPQVSLSAGTQTNTQVEQNHVDIAGMMQAQMQMQMQAQMQAALFGAMPGMLPIPTNPFLPVVSSPTQHQFPFGFGMPPASAATATAATSPAMQYQSLPSQPPPPYLPAVTPWTLPPPPQAIAASAQAAHAAAVQAAMQAAAMQMAAMTAGSPVLPPHAASTASGTASSPVAFQPQKWPPASDQAFLTSAVGQFDRSPVAADMAETSPKTRPTKQPPQTTSLFAALSGELPDASNGGHRGTRRPARLWVHIYLHMQAPDFDLVPMLIGRGGCNMRKIADRTRAKVRIRGRGSGHLEADNQQEAPTPLMVAVTTDHQDAGGFKEAVRMTLHELQTVSQRFQIHCDKKGHPFTGPYYSIGLLPPGAEESLGDLLQGVPTNVPAKPTNAQIASAPLENLQ